MTRPSAKRPALAAVAAAALLACNAQAASSPPEQVAAGKPETIAFPPARALVPFVAEGDVGCTWTMRERKGEWTRGSIERGDEDPMMGLDDNVFKSWSDSEDHMIEVSVGDAERRLPARAWATYGGDEAPGSIGFYMDSELRKLIGGATSVQVWKGGKPVFNTLLANTPSSAELDDCVRPPTDPAETDEE